ncbi:hypothetical protein [Cupriavidus basilensis]|uniref:hypothetical protein n=1 Tax=Cupriavidus basilensis TaxID=68895 RepID=UPI0020A6BFF6|nr:hypothetical protein [Cupriavidus basilensis]MCP3019040.1 hypothetical protein [Cupriavidus basilensis]
MTSRRRFLALLGMTSLTTTGCTRMTAKKIEEMPREYALLMDPEKRRKALGDQRLKISSADFGLGGTDFYKLEWENIHFYDCIFYGVIHLSRISNCIFEHCQFPGSNFQAYAIEEVLFLRSDTIGGANLMAGNKSKNVRFVECDFGGKNPDDNRYGAIYFNEDVSYERCTGQYMHVSGNGIVNYRDCKFGSIYAKNGTWDNGKQYRATVTIDNCTFKGETQIARSSLTSLTIRNSKFDILEIGQSDVLGDVLIEGVQAGAMVDMFANARSITIRNSRFRGVNVNPEENYYKLYRSLDCFVSLGDRKSLKSVVLENVECGRDDQSDRNVANQVGEAVSGCWIMGGQDSTVIRNCTIPKAALWLDSADVLIDNFTADKSSFVTSKIGSLTFRNTNIVKAIDFTGVQVQKLDAKGLVRYTGQQILTDGSNIQL